VPELVHAPVLKEEGHESRQPAATSSKSLARGQTDSDLVTPAVQAAATLNGDGRARSSSLIGTECSKMTASVLPYGTCTAFCPYVTSQVFAWMGLEIRRDGARN
jgi:hypothetical protein